MSSYKLEKSPQVLTILVVSTAVLDLAGEALNVFVLRLFKPLPILLMILIMQMAKDSSGLAKMVFIGLILSVVGDILLMWSSLTMFMAGTLFFLIAHICYIIGFRKSESSKKAKYPLFIRAAQLLVLASFVLNIYQLWDKLPNKILFPLYGLTLALMVITALSRYQRTTSKSFYLVLAGAACFAISDNLLAHLKFNGGGSNLGRFCVMLTYYTAQGLIMRGALAHEKYLAGVVTIRAQ